MTASRQASVPPVANTKKAWVKQPSTGIVFVLDMRFSSILGTEMDEYQRSKKEKWPRKKYMG
jgi:hypothetical protein